MKNINTAVMSHLCGLVGGIMGGACRNGKKIVFKHALKTCIVFWDSTKKLNQHMFLAMSQLRKGPYLLL